MIQLLQTDMQGNMAAKVLEMSRLLMPPWPPPNCRMMLLHFCVSNLSVQPMSMLMGKCFHWKFWEWECRKHWDIDDLQVPIDNILYSTCKIPGLNPNEAAIVVGENSSKPGPSRLTLLRVYCGSTSCHISVKLYLVFSANGNMPRKKQIGATSVSGIAPKAYASTRKSTYDIMGLLFISGISTMAWEQAVIQGGKDVSMSSACNLASSEFVVDVTVMAWVQTVNEQNQVDTSNRKSACHIFKCTEHRFELFQIEDQGDAYQCVMVKNNNVGLSMQQLWPSSAIPEPWPPPVTDMITSSLYIVFVQLIIPWPSQPQEKCRGVHLFHKTCLSELCIQEQKPWHFVLHATVQVSIAETWRFAIHSSSEDFEVVHCNKFSLRKGFLVQWDPGGFEAWHYYNLIGLWANDIRMTNNNTCPSLLMDLNINITWCSPIQKDHHQPKSRVEEPEHEPGGGERELESRRASARG